MDVKYSHEIPEVYYRCREQFGVDWNKGIIITYGDTVYCKFPITEDLKVHEATHVRQQTEMGKEIWWERYFTDKDFRLSQEVEAYKNQLEFARKFCNRERRRLLEKKIADDMSRLYGNMCSKERARELIHG